VMKSDEILIKTFDQVKNDNFDQVKFDQVIVCLLTPQLLLILFCFKSEISVNYHYNVFQRSFKKFLLWIRFFHFQC
jgi:hypothetical protein